MQARLVAIALVAATTLAEARPSVTIRGELPFDERSLGEAVELRGLTDVDVIVGRDDQGRLVVEAGGRTQTVVLVTSDPQSAARVVAMVVVELVAEPSAPAMAPPGETAVVAVAPAVVPPPRGPSKLSARLVPALLRDDNGYTTALVTGSLAYSLTRSIRAVGTTGIGLAGKSSDREMIVPLRLGLEGSSGAIALELGGVTHPYSSRCGTGMVATGVYGVLRMYAPIGERARLVIEGGGDFLLGYSTNCFESYGYREYGGWIGVGGEWPL